MKLFRLLKEIIFFSLLLSCMGLRPEGGSTSNPAAKVAITNVIATICPPVAPVLVIGELIVSGILVGIGFYTTRKFSRNKQEKDWFKKDWNIESSTVFGGPDPEQKNNFFEKIKLKADKKSRHKRFGNFYRDPETKLWWSKDNGGHGGSEFKVFKENAKGLEWIYDADGVGNKIVEKHKGPIGLFIPYKDLIPCA